MHAEIYRIFIDSTCKIQTRSAYAVAANRCHIKFFDIHSLYLFFIPIYNYCQQLSHSPKFKSLYLIILLHLASTLSTMNFLKFERSRELADTMLFLAPDTNETDRTALTRIYRLYGESSRQCSTVRDFADALRFVCNGRVVEPR